VLKKAEAARVLISLFEHSLSDGEGLEWLRRFNDLGAAVPTFL